MDFELLFQRVLEHHIRLEIFLNLAVGKILCEWRYEFDKIQRHSLLQELL